MNDQILRLTCFAQIVGNLDTLEAVIKQNTRNTGRTLNALDAEQLLATLIIRHSFTLCNARTIITIQLSNHKILNNEYRDN